MTNPDCAVHCAPTVPFRPRWGKADDCAVPSPSPTGDGTVSSPRLTVPSTVPSSQIGGQ